MGNCARTNPRTVLSKLGPKVCSMDYDCRADLVADELTNILDYVNSKVQFVLLSQHNICNRLVLFPQTMYPNDMVRTSPLGPDHDPALMCMLFLCLSEDLPCPIILVLFNCKCVHALLSLAFLQEIVAPATFPLQTTAGDSIESLVAGFSPPLVCVLLQRCFCRVNSLSVSRSNLQIGE